MILGVESTLLIVGLDHGLCFLSLHTAGLALAKDAHRSLDDPLCFECTVYPMPEPKLLRQIKEVLYPQIKRVNIDKLLIPE